MKQSLQILVMMITNLLKAKPLLSKKFMTSLMMHLNKEVKEAILLKLHLLE